MILPDGNLLLKVTKEVVRGMVGEEANGPDAKSRAFSNRRLIGERGK